VLWWARFVALCQTELEDVQLVTSLVCVHSVNCDRWLSSYS